MPVLHFQVSGHALGPGGNQIPLPPAQLLGIKGPMVPVSLNVPPEIAAQLTRDGKPLPPSVGGLALIDTGATSSCIDQEAAIALQLPVVNVIKMTSATHSDVDTNVYPVNFDILGAQGKIPVNCPRAAAAALKNQGLVLLIGRDLLAVSHFVYNGLAGEFTICF